MAVLTTSTGLEPSILHLYHEAHKSSTKVLDEAGGVRLHILAD